MPAPATVDEFLDLIRKSGVAEDQRLTAYVGKLAAEAALPAEPGKLAGLLVRDGVLTYFQADQILQGKWKRFAIGKYRVLERLGTGGMAQVFLCEHKLMRRRVAVKVLPVAKASDPASLERFYREARAVAAVDHPNIVRAYDIDQDQGLHFLVMEYVDGVNLHDLIRKSGPLDPVRACHYIAAAAVGLQHAHEMGLVHRDIKPSNLLVDRSGVVKILDLGLARFFHDEDDKITRKFDENVLGTADYLAPEQAMDSHAVDIRADIYSLGGTLYYLLTGQPPFPDGTVAQKLLWHQTREFPSAADRRPDLPPGLAAVLARMTAKEPADRYQTPGGVTAALAPWTQSPVAPPSDQELPVPSPAAQPPGGPVSVRGGSTTIGIGSATQVGGLTLTPPTLAPVPPGSLEPVAPPPADAPPAAAPDPFPANLFTDIEAPAETADESADAPPPAVVPSRKNPPPRRTGLLVAVVAGVGLLAVGGGVAFLAFGRSSPLPRPPGPVKWYVTQGADSPDPQHTVGTLRGALELVGEGQSVVLLDDRLDEGQVTFAGRRGGKQIKGVTIGPADPAKRVLWTVRPGPQSGALDLIDADGVTVSGLVIDCGGAVASGVGVAGNSPGVEVRDVTVRNPRLAGFRLVNAVGKPDRPVRLTGCRVTAGEKVGVGVELSGLVRDAAVERCRLEGPGAAGVAVNGPAVGVSITGNRVARFAAGLVIGGKPGAESDYGLTVSGNTFYDLTDAGVRLNAKLTGPKRTADFTRNYFARTKELLTVAPGGEPAGVKGSDNARDSMSANGRFPTQKLTVADADLGSPGPDTPDADFLKLPPGKLDGFGAR